MHKRIATFSEEFRKKSYGEGNVRTLFDLDYK